MIAAPLGCADTSGRRRNHPASLDAFNSDGAHGDDSGGDWLNSCTHYQYHYFNDDGDELCEDGGVNHHDTSRWYNHNNIYDDNSNDDLLRRIDLRGSC